MGRLPLLAVLVLTAALAGCGAEVGSQESTSAERSGCPALREYYAEVMEVVFQLEPPEQDNFYALLESHDLRRIEEVAGAGYERVSNALKGLALIAPPAEARVWHASVQDTGTVIQGFYLMLEGAARERDANAVAMLLDRLGFGLSVEVDQLGREAESLFRPCF